MRHNLTLQQENKKEEFREWLINETTKRGMDADIGAMMDEYDPHISREANEDFFAEHYGLSRHTPEQYRQMHFQQVEGEVVAKLRDADEQTFKNIAHSLGYMVRKRREPWYIVWEIYGFRSYYSLEEALIIEKELNEKGFATTIFNTTLLSGQTQCVVKYRRDLKNQPAPVLSIE
jgi:hypothetical protein